jgi:glycosyltransferase involved in cell wall biosynthesis
MSKHILVVSQYYNPENFRINDITNEWIKRGYKVTVVTGIPNYPKGRFFKGYGYFKKRREVINGIKIIRLAIIPRFNNPLFLALNYISFIILGWFWSKFTKLKADIVFNFEVSPMTQALPAIWFAKRRKIPSYVYVQDLWPENLQIVGNVNNKFIVKRVNKMVDYIYRSATKILVTSPSFKNNIIERGIDENKIKVWYQYAEDFFKPIKKEFRKSGENMKIIFAGNIGEAQGLEILPLVAKQLKTKGFENEIRFIIVGNGRNKNALTQKVSKEGVNLMFHFVDAVPASLVPKILSDADVAFVSFKNNELFKKTIPAKLQTYLACGMPILAVASGETKRIVEEARCGLVSSPGDVDGTINNIIDFFNCDSRDLSDMSLNSVQYSRRYFNKKKLMDKIDIYFKEV